MKKIMACFIVIAAANFVPAAEPVPFKVGEISVEVDPALRGNWEFSNFTLKGSGSDMMVQCIAIRHRPPFAVDRWYGYDANDVKIAEGPLAYQDYLKDEKTLIEMNLGEKAKEIRRIKIAAR